MSGMWALSSVKHEKHVQSICESQRGLWPSEQLLWAWLLHTDPLVPLGVECSLRLPVLLRTDVSQTV